MVSEKKGVLDVIAGAIEKVENSIIIVLFAEVIIVGFMQVLFRFVLKSSLSWSEELLRFSFIWLTYIASSIGIMKGTHATVDVVLEKLPRAANSIARLLIEILTLGFCTTIFLLSLQVVGMQMGRSQVSAAMGVPIWVPYGGIVVGFCFMSFHALCRTIQAVKNLAKPKEA